MQNHFEYENAHSHSGSTLNMHLLLLLLLLLLGRYEHGEMVLYFRCHAVSKQNDKPSEQRYVIVAPGASGYMHAG